MLYRTGDCPPRPTPMPPSRINPPKPPEPKRPRKPPNTPDGVWRWPYASSRCAEICPVDACAADSAHKESKDQLLAKWKKLHPGETPKV